MLQGVQSVLAVGLNYYVDTDRTPKDLSIARYGWGKDYHKIIKGRLKLFSSKLISKLAKAQKTKIKVFVDNYEKFGYNI